MHPTTPATSRGARRLAAAAGVASATVTLGLAHLAAQAVGPSSSPLAAVGSAFVDATPAWLKEAAIAAFSTNDKLALVVGMLVVLM
ncbi:MAG: oxidoreductase, partial [Cellulomonadaceae bacterium]|nr:oxidoreductase [Cellulomonadaceae bacterium]